MRKILHNALICLVAALTFITAGCNKETTYSKHGMTITMDEGFEERTHKNFTWYLVKGQINIAAIKEAFEGDFNKENYDLETYTEAVQRANDTDIEVHTRENQGYMYYHYTKTIETNTFFYLVTIHDSEDAYWLVQFACLESNKESHTDKFLTWADSITFEIPNNQ